MRALNGTFEYHKHEALLEATGRQKLASSRIVMKKVGDE